LKHRGHWDDDRDRWSGSRDRRHRDNIPSVGGVRDRDNIPRSRGDGRERDRNSAIRGGRNWSTTPGSRGRQGRGGSRQR
jgi:hypothetical protein